MVKRYRGPWFGAHRALQGQATGAKYGPTGQDADIYVDAQAGDDGADGETWETAYRSIERAVSDIEDTDLEFERLLTIRCRGDFGLDGRVLVHKAVRGKTSTTAVLGGLEIRGEPATLDEQHTVDSVAAGADSTLVDVDLGVAPGSPFVAGRQFLEQTVIGRKVHYPVTAIAGSVVTIVGNPALLTPGESVRLHDVTGATIRNASILLDDTTHLYGFRVRAGSIANNTFSSASLQQAFTFTGPLIGALSLEDSPLSSFITRLAANGLFLGASFPVLNGTSIDNVASSGAGRLFVDEAESAIITMRHLNAVSPKVDVRGGKLFIFGSVRLGGAGTAFRVVDGAKLHPLFGAVSVAPGLTRLYEVRRAGVLTVESSPHSGTVSGVSVVLSEASFMSGMEANAGSLASTPAGSDVTVGALATSTFAALPATDATQLVRAT